MNHTILCVLGLLVLMTMYGVQSNNMTLERIEAKLDRIIDYQGLNEVVAE